MNASRGRTSIIYIILFMVIIFTIIFNLNQTGEAVEALTLNDIAAEIQAGNVERIVQDNDRLFIEFNDGRFVAATTMTFVSVSNPSISTNI